MDTKTTYSNWQIFSLTLLRVMIGWHFLYEGLTKLYTPGWTAGPYLSGAIGPLSPVFKSLAGNGPVLRMVDILNEWGLILIGLALFTGLLSKPAKISGIVLLFLYYLAYPPFAGLGVDVQAEGSYWIVNKNLVEMAALVVLLVFRSSHVTGIDRFLVKKKMGAAAKAGSVLSLCFLLLASFGSSILSGNNQSDGGRLSRGKVMQEGQWQVLFNGRNLDGWKAVGGNKSFTVEDGMIMGTVAKGPGENFMEDFLVTEKDYDDFILELEFRIDPGSNSGVQIRSGTYVRDTVTTYTSGNLEVSRQEWKAGAVHGYQVEIDPSPRAWSGGIYEQGGRGWLQNLLENPEARNAFIGEGWNRFSVKVQGGRIETWINGVKAADFTDGLSKKGFIGLQVEGSIDGKKVFFRDIRVKEL